MSDVVVPKLPDNPSLLTRARLGLKALMIVKDDPGHPEAGALINDCFDLEVYAEQIARLKQTPHGRRLLAERPSLQGPELDLDALDGMPEGTLGRALARYFRDNNISPFVTRQPIERDVDYISKRYRETHDIYHLVTGYGTDLVGEMALQAFAMGNLGIRSPWFILPFGYLASLMPGAVGALGEAPPRMMPMAYIRLLRTAHRRGAQARPFLDFPFEDHWGTPLADLRQQLLGEAESQAA